MNTFDILGTAAHDRLVSLLNEAAADNRSQVLALHDPERGFALWVEVVSGMPVMWRITGPVLPAQAQRWFADLATTATPQRSN